MSLGATVSGLATAAVFVIFLALAFETARLARREPPITAYTRYVVRRHTVVALITMAVLILLVGIFSAHFIWDAGCIHQ